MAHYAHITVSKQLSVLGDSYKEPLLLHVTYPNQILQEGEYKAVSHHVTKVVAVMHNRDHYAVMVIDIPGKKVQYSTDFTRTLTNGWIMS